MDNIICYRLFGFMKSPYNDLGFVLPIFHSHDSFWVQNIDGTDHISGFFKINESNCFVQTEYSSANHAKIGDKAIFAFALGESTVLFGSKEKLSKKLRSSLEKLYNHPFILVDVAKFIGDDELLIETIKSAYSDLSIINAETANKWIQLTAYDLLNRITDELDHKTQIVMNTIVTKVQPFLSKLLSNDIDRSKATWRDLTFSSLKDNISNKERIISLTKIKSLIEKKYRPLTFPIEHIKQINDQALIEEIAFNIIQGRVVAEDEGFDAGLEGKPAVTELVKEAIKNGIDPKAIVIDALTESMEFVGEKFERGEYLIPDMLASAECVGAAMDILSPHIVKVGVKTKGKFIIATVAGDLHDIGKNIVSIMLKGAGYDVIDLGADVPTDRIIEAVKEHQAPYLGLSALLTTTMREMDKVIKRLIEVGLRDKVHVLIGGATTSEAFAREIGADIYCRDALQAIDRLRNMPAM